MLLTVVNSAHVMSSCILYEYLCIPIVFNKRQKCVRRCSTSRLIIWLISRPATWISAFCFISRQNNYSQRRVTLTSGNCLKACVSTLENSIQFFFFFFCHWIDFKTVFILLFGCEVARTKAKMCLFFFFFLPSETNHPKQMLPPNVGPPTRLYCRGHSP